MIDKNKKNLRALDLNLLPILRELLYAENVSRAAERLCMTQPSVSEALGRIRAQFGDEILVRAGRKMVATPFALSLIDPLDEILGKVEGLRVLQQSVSAKNISQSFVIATGDSAILTFGQSLLSFLYEELPNVDLQFVELQNFDLRQLKSGEVDMAIVPSQFVNDEMICRQSLYREDFVVIGRKGHPVLGQGRTNSEVLADVHKIGYRAHLGSDIRVPPPRGWHEHMLVTQMSLLPCLVQHSDSIALIQRHIAMQFLPSMNIEIYELEDFSWFADVYAFWGSINSHSLVHTLLRKALKQMLNADSGYQILPNK